MLIHLPNSIIKQVGSFAVIKMFILRVNRLQKWFYKNIKCMQYRI